MLRWGAASLRPKNPAQPYRIVGATRRVAHPPRRVAHPWRVAPKNPPTIYRRGAAMLRPYATPRQPRNTC